MSWAQRLAGRRICDLLGIPEGEINSRGAAGGSYMANLNGMPNGIIQENGSITDLLGMPRARIREDGLIVDLVGMPICRIIEDPYHGPGFQLVDLNGMSIGVRLM